MTGEMIDTLTDTLVGFDRIPTGVIGADTDEDILISQSAINEIHNILESSNVPDGYFLRIGTRGGGCSGMTYVLAFDEKPRENDKIMEQHGIKMFVDPKSLFFLSGTVLDFSDGLNGKGFVFNNPQATRTCGCGQSFGV